METKVVLFSYTADIERICAAAMRSCYSPHAAYSLYTYRGASPGLANERIFDDGRVRSMIAQALELGHLDILEHGSLTFDIQGISRACSHQLVRHRLASYSQQSQRYVKISKGYGYIKPPSLNKVDRVQVTIEGHQHSLSFEDVMDLTKQMEEALVSRGIKSEDARYLRANAASTNIVATMNPRELLHVFNLRCAPDAQWEIRDIAWAMLACSRLVAPTIFSTPSLARHSDHLKKTATRLDAFVEDARARFERADAGSLIEIDLRDAGLEHDVRAFVAKL